METFFADFFDADALAVLTGFLIAAAFVPDFFTAAFFAATFFVPVDFVPDDFAATFFTPAFAAPDFAVLVLDGADFFVPVVFAPVFFATAFFAAVRLSAEAGRTLMLRRAAMISTTSKRISSPIFMTSRAERGGGLPSRRKGTYPRTSPSAM